MTLIEEQDCPHIEMSPAMKKYSTIPVDYDEKMYSTESLVVEDDPIVHVICTNPPIYKTKSGKEYYDTAKTKPYISSYTTDYETAKHQVDEYIKTLNDKKVKPYVNLPAKELDNNYKFVGIFNENLADRDILAVTLTLRPDVGTIDFICDMMDARLPFDLHFTENGVVEIYYDRRD